MSSIRKSKGNDPLPKSNKPIALISLLGAFFPAAASAQVIATEDATATVVKDVGDRFDIVGGQTSSDQSNLFHSFEQFDISAEQTANFVTESAVQNVISTISSHQASTVDGTLQISGSEATLYLVNPAGVFIGPNARLNLSGGFTATSATDIGFDNGRYTIGSGDYSQLNGQPSDFYFSNAQPGTITNAGELSVEKGEAISLIGGNVVNTGQLNAPNGTITMAAVEGENLVRISQADQLLSLEVEPASLGIEQNEDSDSFVQQSQRLGEILTGGTLEHAASLEIVTDGSVQLTSSRTEDVSTLPRGGSAIASGILSTTGRTGGNINILGKQVDIVDATIEASGEIAGGFIRVGGDFQGKEGIVTADNVFVDESSTFTADAIQRGEGGRVIIWSDETTTFDGSIHARGGTLEGNGGFAEVSGKRQLSFAGSVDLSADVGSVGTLLLDPENWVVTDVIEPPNTATTSYISSLALESLSLTSDISLTADDNITIADLSDDTLNIAVGRAVSFIADADGDGTGAFTMADRNDTIRAEQGDLVISGADISVGILNTSTDKHNGGGSSNVSAGNISLFSTGDVAATELLAFGSLTTITHHSASGGTVIVDALGGNIAIDRGIETYSYVDGREADAGGNISLNALDDITVGSLANPDDQVLFTASIAEDGEISEKGGNISLTSNRGDIAVFGAINTTSETSADDADDGGNVLLQALLGSVTTADIFTGSSAGNNSAGKGGAVNILANGNIELGDIDSSSQTVNNEAGDAGSISLDSNSGDILAGALIAESIANRNNGTRGDRSGNGGDVSVEATNGNVSITSVSTSVSAVDNQSGGDAGAIQLTAGGQITTAGDVSAYSVASEDAENRSTNGGEISISAPSIDLKGSLSSFSRGYNAAEGGDTSISSNDFRAGAIQTFSEATLSSGNAGDFTLSKLTPALSSTALIDGDINAYSFASDRISEEGGEVDLTADLIDIFGNIATFSEARSNDASDAGDVTISAAEGITVQGHVYAFSRTGGVGSGDLVGDGANVTLSGSDVDVVGSIQTFSTANRNSHNAGDITINARDSLEVGRSLSNALLAYSHAEQSGASGNGGDISLIADRIRTGAVGTWSRTEARNNASDSNSGQAGSVTMSEFSAASNSLVDVTGGIFADSVSYSWNAEEGGDVAITADSVAVPQINASSTARRNASSGGDIRIEGEQIISVLGSIRTDSLGNRNAAGGDIYLGADSIAVGTVSSNSFGSDSSQSAGRALLEAGSQLSVGSISAIGSNALQDADVELRGDRILFQRNNAVRGANVAIKANDVSRDISIVDNPSQPINGNQLQIDLAAIDIASKIEVGSEIDEGVVSLDNTLDGRIDPQIRILGGDRLIAPTGLDSTFQLTGPGSGRLANPNVVFENIENLIGGNRNNSFTTDPNVSLDGFDSLDNLSSNATLDFSGFGSNPLTVDLDRLNNFQTVIGAGISSTLRGEDADNVWEISGQNAGVVNRGTSQEIYFSEFGNLAGGALSDRFVFETEGSLSDSVLGGAGNNTLDFGQYESSVLIEGSSAQGRATNEGNSTITRFEDVLSILGSTEGAFQNNIIALGSIDSNNVLELTGEHSGILDNSLTITGLGKFVGAGVGNTVSLRLLPANLNGEWQINGINKGRVNGVLFESVQNLIGGEGNDNFTYIAGSIAGSLDGKQGFNRITGSEGDDSFLIVGNGNTPRPSFSGSINGSAFENINALEGSGGTDILSLAPMLPVSADAENQWEVGSDGNGNVDGIEFSSFEQLVGGSGRDRFVVLDVGSSTGIQIDGGDDTPGQANNTAVAAENNTVWAVTGRNQGTISRQDSQRLADFSNIQNFQQDGTEPGEQRIVFATDTARVTGAIDSGDSDLALVGNQVSLGEVGGSAGPLNRLSGTQRLTIETLDSATDIQLGGAFSAVPGLHLNSAELEMIQDGFETIAIGGEGYQGTISALSDLTFQDAIALETDADINLGTFSLRGSDTDANVRLISGANITANSLTTTATSISVAAQQNINITSGTAANHAISTNGQEDGAGIDIVSDRGSVSIIGALETSGEEYGNRISVAAQERISLQGNIDTTGLRESGDITLESKTAPVDIQGLILARAEGENSSGGNVSVLASGAEVGSNLAVNVSGFIDTRGSSKGGNVFIATRNGGIRTGAILTTNTLETGSGSTFSALKPGNVNLQSQGDISIGFIDARGTGRDTRETNVYIETTDSFVARTAPATTAASISTVGTNNGSTTIAFGDRNQVAAAFRVTRNSGRNGTAGKIQIPGIEILQAEFENTYIEQASNGSGRIEILNRGLAPEVSVEMRPVMPPNIVIEPAIPTLDVPPAGLESTDSSTEIIVSATAETTELSELFTQLETTFGQGFSEYFSLGESHVSQDVATLADMQQTLADVEGVTDTTPAMIYVYFVPDATKEASVIEADRQWQGSNPVEEVSTQSDDQLEVMVVTAHQPPVRQRLWGVTRAQVSAIGRQLRQEVTNQFSTRQQYLAPAQQLYSWFVKPVEETLQSAGVESLGFVMDNGLRTLPLATLHDGDRFLVENYSLGIMPSFSLTEFETTEVSRTNFDDANVLALGASEFTDQPDLPAVAAEVDLVSRQLGGGDAFLNEDFILDNIQNQLQAKDYNIMHMATHAAMTAANSEDAYIQLWDEKLLLSDLHKLGLGNTRLDLIILSACNTALGNHTSEYGFAGFAVNTGLRSALASLWPVNDEGTLGFMAQFYEGLQTSPVKADALRQAQLSMLNGEVGVTDGNVYGPNDEIIANIAELEASGRWEFTHPFYWSAFTMIGNPW